VSTEAELLSREELDAILSSADSLAAEEPNRLAAPFRSARERTRTGPRLPELHRAFEWIASRYGRELASRHQRRIQCELAGWEELGAEEAIQFLIASDRVVLFETRPTAATGFVLFSRPVVFGLLSLSFGGRRVDRETVPARAYTRIEQRFLRWLAEGFLPMVESEIEPLRGVAFELGAVGGPAEILDRCTGPLLVATLDLAGLVPVGRVRVALPLAGLEAPLATKASERGGADRAPASIEALVQEVGLDLRVELGSADITLRRLGELQPGDVIHLQPSDPEGYLVRIEGQPKFTATPGSVGSRLAVQIQDRWRRRGGKR
jgi:flagellar motor switch protein FliM